MLQNYKYGCNSPQRLNAVVAVFMEIGILWNCCRGFKECGHNGAPSRTFIRYLSYHVFGLLKTDGANLACASIHIILK